MYLALTIPPVADKGYASKANRETARARGIVPVIPHKANEKNKPAFFTETIYKACGRIEQAFGRLKRFNRVALQCENRAELRIDRKFRCRHMLDQIRPHGLGQAKFGRPPKAQGHRAGRSATAWRFEATAGKAKGRR